MEERIYKVIFESYCPICKDPKVFTDKICLTCNWEFMNKKDIASSIITLLNEDKKCCESLKHFMRMPVWKVLSFRRVRN